MAAPPAPPAAAPDAARRMAAPAAPPAAVPARSPPVPARRPRRILSPHSPARRPSRDASVSVCPPGGSFSAGISTNAPLGSACAWPDFLRAVADDHARAGLRAAGDDRAALRAHPDDIDARQDRRGWRGGSLGRGRGAVARLRGRRVQAEPGAASQRDKQPPIRPRSARQHRGVAVNLLGSSSSFRTLCLITATLPSRSRSTIQDPGATRLSTQQPVPPRAQLRHRRHGGQAGRQSARHSAGATHAPKQAQSARLTPPRSNRPDARSAPRDRRSNQGGRHRRRPAGNNPAHAAASTSAAPPQPAGAPASSNPPHSASPPASPRPPCPAITRDSSQASSPAKNQTRQNSGRATGEVATHHALQDGQQRRPPTLEPAAQARPPPQHQHDRRHRRPQQQLRPVARRPGFPQQARNRRQHRPAQPGTPPRQWPPQAAPSPLPRHSNPPASATASASNALT